jgi:hypothetical protein
MYTSRALSRRIVTVTCSRFMKHASYSASPASSEGFSTLLSSFQDLGQGLEETLLPLAWRIVNDSFRTDVCLLFPPFQIALACLHMASVILGRFYSRFYVLVLRRTVLDHGTRAKILKVGLFLAKKH